MKTNKKLKKAHLTKVAGRLVGITTGDKLAITEAEQKSGSGYVTPKEKRHQIVVLGKQQRNDLCSCGSGKKNKKCCGEGTITYAMHLGFPYYLNTKK